jgi:Cof subfamily protein (haloacid dehalogenase superfamily)
VNANVKLIVTDLDGTLLRGDKAISSYTEEVLRRCRERDILFAFATSRSENASSRFAAMANPDITITSGGSIAKYAGKTLFRTAISIETATDIIEKLKSSDQIVQITADSEDFYFTSKPIDRNWLGWRDYANAVVTDFASPLPVPDVFKITVKACSSAAVRALVSSFDSVDVMQFTGESWNQIKSRRASKHNALAAVIRHLRIRPQQVVVFGDDANDLDMMALPGVVSVAMENAIDEVKVAADFVCSSNDEDGVAKWLEEHILCA